MSRKNNPNPARSDSKLLAVGQARSFSGSLPDPDTLAGYANIDPDIPGRIIAMAENQANERHRNERLMVGANINSINQLHKERKRGQFLGFFIAVSGFICTAILGWFGMQIAASVVGGTTVVSLVALFITGQYWQDKNKNNELPSFLL